LSEVESIGSLFAPRCRRAARRISEIERAAYPHPQIHLGSAAQWCSTYFVENPSVNTDQVLVKADEAGEWAWFSRRSGKMEKQWEEMEPDEKMDWLRRIIKLSSDIAETDDGQRGLNNRIVKLEQALNGKASKAA
jgi:hypothetical protein